MFARYFSLFLQTTVIVDQITLLGLVIYTMVPKLKQHR